MTKDEKFEALCFHLAEMEISINNSNDLILQCHELRVDPDWVDNMLYEVLGMSAEEVIGQYRKDARRLTM